MSIETIRMIMVICAVILCGLIVYGEHKNREWERKVRGKK